MDQNQTTLGKRMHDLRKNMVQRGNNM